MLKRLFVILFVLFAVTQTVNAGWNLPGAVSAGKDAVKAATLSDEDVNHLAQSASQHYDESNQVAQTSSPYAVRLAQITKGMKNDAGLKPDIKVYITDDVNAFAMANGSIRVYSGLMDKLTDDEVRYVIGHEIGHVNLGHSKKALQVAYAASAGRKAAAASGNGGVVALSDSAMGELAEKLVSAQFSQSQERDADLYALKMMKHNNYDPKAAVSALRKLENLFGNESSVFASHPALGDRANALEKAL
jgi:metalloprotease